MSADATEMKRYKKFIKRWPKGHMVKYQGRVYAIENSGRTNHSSAHYLEDFLFLRWVKSNHEFCFQCSKVLKKDKSYPVFTVQARII